MVETIDWARPWLAELQALGRPTASRVEGGMPLYEALNCNSGAPVRFVPQNELAVGEAYERHIFGRGTVPTRDNLHDFFNGLCWLHFPRTKLRLNQLQAAEIFAAGVQPKRGPVRDALTVFDENAAFLLAPQLLWNALLARDWRRLFVDLRPLWNDAQLVVFGHALLEKLVCPRKPTTAHVYVAQPAVQTFAELDAWVAADLSVARLAAKPFTPLPVLGVPGWWAENENFSFYDDAAVFRLP